MSAESSPGDETSLQDDFVERLREEKAAASTALVAHMASWEYAFAMGHGCSVGDHPIHQAARQRTEALKQRYADTKAHLAEHEL